MTKETIKQIWEKANAITGCNPDVWRQDHAGAWIKFDAYGKQSTFGWEIDHRKPLAKNGSDDYSNLYPLHWMNNRAKGDDYPKFSTSITSSGNTNIEKKRSWNII